MKEVLVQLIDLPNWVAQVIFAQVIFAQRIFPSDLPPFIPVPINENLVLGSKIHSKLDRKSTKLF